MNNEIHALSNLMSDVLNGDKKVNIPKIKKVENHNPEYKGLSDIEKKRIIESDLTANNAVRLYIDYSLKQKQTTSTVETKRKKLRLFVSFLTNPSKFSIKYDIDYSKNFKHINVKVINDYLNTRVRKTSPVLESNNYKVLRAFFNYLVDVENIFNVNFVTETKDNKTYISDCVVETLSDKQVKILLNSLNDSCSTKCRTAVIIHLMLDCGITYNELAALKVEDIDLKEQSITIKGSIAQLDRVVTLSNSTILHIESYLKFRKKHIEYLILDKFSSDSVTPIMISKVLNRLCYSFDFKVSACILRDTFAIKFLKNETNYHMLSYILGIELRTTIARYKNMIIRAQRKGMVDFLWKD